MTQNSNSNPSHIAETAAWSRSMLLHGTVLVIGGLVAGLTIGLAPNPRTVLAAHVIGLTTGMAAMLVGLVLPHVRLSARLVDVMGWTLLPSLYLGFLTQWIGGLGGLSRMFNVTASGQPEGAAWLESLVEYTIKGITPLTLIPFVILIFGLLRARQAP
jgi:hypothetical protein